jgi:hypothetical protein
VQPRIKLASGVGRRVDPLDELNSGLVLHRFHNERN